MPRQIGRDDVEAPGEDGGHAFPIATIAKTAMNEDNRLARAFATTRKRRYCGPARAGHASDPVRIPTGEVDRARSAITVSPLISYLRRNMAWLLGQELLASQAGAGK